MSWARIDDRIAFHPKTIAAGHEALGLWVRLLAYSCAHSTDGFVPTDALATFGDIDALIKKLLKVRLLDRQKGGVAVHDFLDWNPSSDKAKAITNRRREAGRIGGYRSGETRGASDKDRENDKKQRSKREAIASTSDEANAKQVASTKSNPVPSRPVPSHSPLSPPVGGGPSASETDPPPPDPDPDRTERTNQKLADLRRRKPRF